MPTKLTVTAKNPIRIFISVVKEHLQRLTDDAAESLAGEIKDEVVESIAEQTGDWAALSDKYRKFKAAIKLRDGILIATGGYVGSIDYQRDGRGWVVAPSNEKVVDYKGNVRPITYKQLGVMLEFGTRKMPARPHWGPIIHKYAKDTAKVGQEFGNRVYPQLIKEFEKETSKYSGITKKLMTRPPRKRIL